MVDKFGLSEILGGLRKCSPETAKKFGTIALEGEIGYPYQC